MPEPTTPEERPRDEEPAVPPGTDGDDEREVSSADGGSDPSPATEPSDR